MKRIFLAIAIAGTLSTAPMLLARQTSPTSQSPTQTQGDSLSHNNATMAARKSSTAVKTNASSKAKTKAKKKAKAHAKPTKPASPPQ